MTRVLGEKHSETLIRVGNLASSYCKQMRAQKTHALATRVGKVRADVLGKDHQNLAIYVQSLAMHPFKGEDYS